MMFKLILLALLLGSALALPVYKTNHRGGHPKRHVDGYSRDSPLPASKDVAEAKDSFSKVEKTKEERSPPLIRQLGYFGIDMNSFNNYW